MASASRMAVAIPSNDKVFGLDAGGRAKLALRRWRVERCFEDQKSEIGLDQFEGRRYQGLKRHLILSCVSYLFLSRMREEFGGEKSGVDAGATMPSPEPTLRHLAGESPRDDRSSVHSRGHRLSPAA